MALGGLLRIFIVGVSKIVEQKTKTKNTQSNMIGCYLNNVLVPSSQAKLHLNCKLTNTCCIGLSK